MAILPYHLAIRGRVPIARCRLRFLLDSLDQQGSDSLVPFMLLNLFYTVGHKLAVLPLAVDPVQRDGRI